MPRKSVSVKNSLSKTKSAKNSMAMYSKLVKCEFGYHSPVNRVCKGREIEERMYKTKYGNVCVNCYRILEVRGKKAKQALMMIG